MSKLLKKHARKLVGLVATVAVLCGVVVPAVPAYAADATMAASPVTLSVDPGDSFSITIDVNTANEVDTVGCEMSWTGTGELTCTGISAYTGAGSFWGSKTPIQLGGAFDPTTGTTGQVAFGFLGDFVSGGNGPAMQLDFTATAAGTVAIDVFGEQVARGGTPMTVDVTDGSVQIGVVDLVVTQKVEDWVNPGVDYTVTYEVTNQGSAPSTACFTEISVDGTQVLVEACPALAPGATYNSTTVALPYDVDTSGADVVQVCADTDSVTPAQDNLVAEGNETNNCTTNTWGFNQLYFNPATSSVNPGDTFSVDVMMRNNAAPAHAAGFALQLSGDEAEVTGISAGTYFDPNPVLVVGGGFDPATNSTEQFAITMTGAGGVQGEGLLATVDFVAVADGVVNVSIVDIQVKDELNNDIPVTAGDDHEITITTDPSSFYDIYPQPASLAVTYNADGTFEVDVTVTKDGAKTAKEDVITSLILGGTVLETDAWGIGSGTGDHAIHFGPHPLPEFPTYPILPGTDPEDIPHNIQIFADSRDDCLNEINEDNNKINQLLDEMPNLVVISKTETETSPGEWVVEATVMNMGPAAAAANELGIYLGGVLQYSKPVSALAALATEVITSDPIAAPSDHEIMVCVDDAEVVTEWNETDNCLGAGAVNFRVSDDCVTPVAGIVLPQIELTCAGPINVWDWDWEAGETEQITRNYNVRSNVDWQLVATDDDVDTTGGHMLSWDGSTAGTDPVEYVYNNVPAPFNSRVWLQSPMWVEADGGDYVKYSPIIKTGSVIDQIGDDGEDFDVTFKQDILWQDPVLPHGWVYNITVEFIAGATF